MGTIPLLVLALIITTLTNSLLRVGPLMMAVGIGTIVLYTLAVSALALSFGVFYPQFATENAAQIPTSYGGVVYMMASLSLLAIIIMIEAVPVAEELRAWRVGVGGAPVIELVSAGAAVVVVCVSATIIPLRLSLKRLERMEW
jgi:ABC-2 type transport system permease protein